MHQLHACWRRTRYWIGRGLLAAAVVIAIGYFALRLVDFDERRRFAAVQPGMTEDEVLAAIGMPPGEYGPPGARYGLRLS